jgi:4-hydroxybenzoate polyprenyltransferase
MAVFCVLVAALFAAALRPVLQLTLAGMCVLVWLYSARIKRTGLMGNVLVSLLAGSTLLVGGLSAGYVRPTLFPGLLAVLVNLPREIIKGVQDLKGDSLVGGRGVVRKRGKRFALRFSSVLVLILVVVSFLPYAAGVYNRYYLAIVLLLDALLVWTAVLMWGSASLDSLVPEIRAEPERRVVSEASAHLERGLGAEGKRAPARGLEPEGSTEIEHRLETAIRTLKLTMLVGLLAIGLGSF